MNSFRIFAVILSLNLMILGPLAQARNAAARECDLVLTLTKMDNGTFQDGVRPASSSKLVRQLHALFVDLQERSADTIEDFRFLWREVRITARLRALGEKLLNPLNARARAAFNREVRGRGDNRLAAVPWNEQERMFQELGGASYTDIVLILNRYCPAPVLRAELKTHLVLKRSAFFTPKAVLPKLFQPGEVAIFKNGLVIGKITQGPNPRLIEFR